MSEKDLLIISNNFPSSDDSFTGNIFVKEQVRYLKSYFDKVYVISPVAFGIERLRGTRHNNYQFDDVRVFFPKYINNPFFWRMGRSMWVKLETNAIVSLIKKERLHFDLIHAHFTWPSGAVARKLKQIYHVPIIITEHTSSTFTRAVEAQDDIFKDVWNEADRVIRVRRGDINLFKHVGIPLSKVVSIPNGYDHEQFYPLDVQRCRASLNLPVDKKIILYVGNFYGGVKGHRHLIDAMSILTKRRRDILCILIGSGTLQGDIEKQIHLLGLEDFILLPGSKSHQEIPIWMNACDFFVLPSLNEGNPTVMFETLGCGKPFVGTGVGGVPEIITSDDYGLLVALADPEDLAEKILAALDGEWNRCKILQYAERYTWENIAKEVMSVYEEVMGGSLSVFEKY